MSDAEIEEQQQFHARLHALESEHRDLDDVIERLANGTPFDQLQLQRLKKRKLVLRLDPSRAELAHYPVTRELENLADWLGVEAKLKIAPTDSEIDESDA